MMLAKMRVGVINLFQGGWVMEKKKWKKPKLIVLTGEGILQICKDQGGGSP